MAEYLHLPLATRRIPPVSLVFHLYRYSVYLINLLVGAAPVSADTDRRKAFDSATGP
jgi:hypothetical protein